MTSLKRRALAGAIVWTVVVFVIGVTAFLALFDRIAIARFNAVLEDRLLQVSVALSYVPPSEESLSERLVDPAYRRPYSGRYWQASLAEGDLLLVSESLFEETLNAPDPPGEAPVFWLGPGPGGEVRGLSQRVILEDGTEWTVSVAESVASLREQRRFVANGAAVVFLLLGMLGVAGAVGLTSAVLRPMEKLSSDIAKRWAAGTRLPPEAYPSEIAPLVNDINLLVERNQDIVARARRQAADLAHTLKTPAAALRNELEARIASGAELDDALEALDRIDAQLKRTLTRMRAEFSARDVQSETVVPDSVRRLARLFTSIARQATVELDWSAPANLSVPVHPQDFEEALGNLMDNACKWAKSRVQVIARADADDVVIEVHDDGPGVAGDEVAAILAPAYRLDTSKSGTGIGLAITNDLVRAYGGELIVGRSELLGGLVAQLRFSRQPNLLRMTANDVPE